MGGRAAAILLATLTGASAAAEPPGSIEALRAAVKVVLDREGVPGAGLALVDGDRVVWTGGVGYADREARLPVTAETAFRVGSITKSFVALALVRLAEEGRLDLRAPIAELAPEIAIENRWHASAPITLAHLLEHTAGFDDMRPNEMYAPLAAEAAPLVAVLARNPRSRVARWRPGSRMSYANPGYTVAAHVLEKLTERPYEDHLHETILGPLGMDHAALRLTPEIAARLARGYLDDGPPVPYRAIYHRPAGNLMASPRELAALVRLALARGAPLVSPAGMARIERSETAELRGTDLDYGLGNFGDVAMAAPSRGHDGGIDGFLSSYGYVPSQGVGWVVLLNSTRSYQALLEIRALAAAHLLAGRDLPPPPRVPVPDDALARLVGSYRPDAPRLALLSFLDDVGPRIEIEHTPSRLWVGRQGERWRVELIPMGGDCFRLPATSGCVLRFGEADGRRVVVGGAGHLAEEPAWLAAVWFHGSRVVFWVLGSGLLLIGWRRWWPTWTAATAFLATPAVFVASARAAAFGEPNAYTVGICILTIVFALASVVCLLTAPWRAGLAARTYAWLFAAGAILATAFFAAHGLIGLRLWAW
jgi:CubicO group peptidase (beta-lactamase class C family)